MRDRLQISLLIILTNFKRINKLLFPLNKIQGEQKLIKGALSCLRQFLASEIPLTMIDNVLYFSLKALFVLKIFKFLS